LMPYHVSDGRLLLQNSSRTEFSASLSSQQQSSALVYPTSSSSSSSQLRQAHPPQPHHAQQGEPTNTLAENKNFSTFIHSSFSCQGHDTRIQKQSFFALPQAMRHWMTILPFEHFSNIDKLFR
jgi:hypothetical protein